MWFHRPFFGGVAMTLHDFACSYILLLPKVCRKDSEILPWYSRLQVFDFWIDEPISTASEVSVNSQGLSLIYVNLRFWIWPPIPGCKDLAKKIFQSHGVRPSGWNAARHGIRSSTPDPPFPCRRPMMWKDQCRFVWFSMHFLFFTITGNISVCFSVY